MEVVETEKERFEPPEIQQRLQVQLSRVLTLRGKERMEAILRSEAPRELFQSLPEEEAYLTIKEIGEQDALPLLSLFSPEQCQFLLDLELWRGYELQTDKVAHWLPLLLSCDEDALEQWLAELDEDTLLLLLKKLIRLHVKNGDEPLEIKGTTETLFTLDGMYYVEVLVPAFQTQVENLLRYLARNDLRRYWDILHQVDAEILAELEERALHFREARLEDKGFPPMEEALALFQPLHPERLKRMLEAREIHLPGLPEKKPLPFYPLVLQDETMFFSLCLKEVEEETLLERLKMELAYMANQVMIADQPESIEVSTIQRSLSKVGGYLSVGLEWLSEGDVEKAKGWIERVPLKYIFQVGFRASLELNWRAKRIGQWFADRAVPLSFLGSPWEERLAGVLKKKPLFFDETSVEGYREFRTLSEIGSLHHDLDRIETLIRVVSFVSSSSWSEGFCWKRVLLRAFVEEEMEPSLLTDSTLVERGILGFCAARWEKGALRERLMSWLQRKTGTASDRNLWALLEEIVESLLDEIRPARCGTESG
jgi:hypothetical protein